MVTATKTGGERNETRFAEYFAEAFGDARPDADRNGHVSVLEAFDYAKNKVDDGVRAGRAICLTEHAMLDDGATAGQLAAQCFSPRTGSAADAHRDGIAIRRCAPCSSERDALESQVDGLQAAQGRAWTPASTTSELEKLLTELALKTRAIRRSGEAKK